MGDELVGLDTENTLFVVEAAPAEAATWAENHTRRELQQQCGQPRDEGHAAPAFQQRLGPLMHVLVVVEVVLVRRPGSAVRAASRVAGGELVVQAVGRSIATGGTALRSVVTEAAVGVGAVPVAALAGADSVEFVRGTAV